MNTSRVGHGLSQPHSIWRFAGPLATSQKVVLPVLGLLFINAFVAGLFPEDEPRRQQLGVLLVASVTAWLFFTLIGLLIQLTLKRLTISRVIAVAMMYALTELIRISTVFAFIDEQQVTSAYGNEFRVAGSLATGLLFLAAAATVFNDSAAYRSTFATRANRVILAEAALGQAEANIAQTRLQTITRVRHILTTELSKALLMSKSKTSQAAALSGELFRVSDGVVRALSAELYNSVPAQSDVTTDAVTARVRFRDLIQSATGAQPFRPLQIGVVSALFTAPTLLLLDAPIFIAIWVLFIAAVFALSAFGQRFVAPRLPDMPMVLRIALITALTAPPLAGYIALAIVPSLGELSLTPTLVLYTLILGAFIGWAIAISEGLRVARERILDELTVLDHQRHWSNTRAQCQLWLDQKRLALTLHNTVQGNLLAAAMKLRRALEAGSEPTQKVASEVHELVKSSLQLEPGRSKRQTLRELTEELNNTWAALIKVTTHCDPKLATLLSKDAVALEIVAEVMSEFVMNSLKHGSATQADVEVTQPSHNIVALQLRNNGSPIIGDTGRVGLGSHFIDSVAITYETANLPDGFEISLQLPLSPG